MHPPETSAASVLVAHAASLRALARHLLLDPHEAEDALQETLVIALERPPRNTSGLGAWLRVVLRSVISNRRRAETRRVVRERAVARPEVRDAGDEQARALRTVVEAVLALDEPYRGTILARYFDGLAPREIARRDGVPVHTVESRLQRALTQLRAKLGREFGERHGGSRNALMRIACLPPWGNGDGFGWGSESVVVTKTKLVLTGIIVIVSVGLWLGWPLALPPDLPAEPLASAVALPESNRTPIPAAPVSVPTEPDPISPVVARRPVPPPPSEQIRVSVRVTTSAGVPVQGAAVLVSPSGQSLNDVATTGDEGSAEARLLATAKHVDLVVCAWHPRLGLSGPWRMAASSRTTTQIDLALDETALPDLDTLAQTGHHAGDEHEAVGKPGVPMLRAILHSPAAARGKDAVQLVRSNFQSLERAQHLWSREGAAQGRGFGSAWSELLVDRGRALEWNVLTQPREKSVEDPLLDPGRGYVGTWGTQGTRVEGRLRLEWVVMQSGLMDARSVPADPGGSFRFKHLPAGPAILLASLSGGPRLPWLVAAEVEPWSTEQRHELPTQPLDMGSVRLRIQEPEAATQQEFFRLHQDFEVRVWTQWGLGVERCTWMDLDSRSGGFQLSGLAPGSYMLEIGSEFDGWIEQGPIQVEGGVESDLGELEPPERGFVDVDRKEGSRGVRWLVRRGVVETLLDVVDESRGGPAHHVPPGEYLFLDPSDRANGVAFTVQAGDSVVVDDEGAQYREKH